MQGKTIITTAMILAIAFVATGFLAANQVMTNTTPSSNQLFLIPNSETGVITNIHPVAAENMNQHVSVMVTLQYRNQAYLNQFLSEVQNPSSPMYHHYMTSQEFSSTFSASSTEYYHYVEYFQTHGFSVSTYPDHVSIALSGSIGQFETLFGTTIGNFKTANNQFYAPTTQLSLPVYYGAISSIVGLSDQYKATISPMFQGSGSSQTLYGADFQNAYQLSQLYQKYGYPTNETIATILWSGTNSAGQDVAPFVPSDISYYYSNNIPSNEPQPVAYGYPILGAPAPGPSAANDNTQADYESTLDLEMAGSAAPGAHIVEVYGPSSTQSDLDQAFAAVLNPSYNASVNSALSHVVAISNSWGGTDTNDSTWMQYEQEAAARGITVLASSGDDGDTSSPAPSFPATMSYNNFGTLAVGGTATVLTGTASTDGSGTTGIQTQSVWYNTPNSGDGSQGGVSSIFAEPSWQAGSSDANGVITGASSTTGVSSGRGTPDVAADGANMEIYITYSGSSSYQELWGTSIASPLTAGVIAVMDHSLGTPEGFINPLIYKFGQEQYSGTFSGAPALYFVSNGSNGAFSAENGYSLAVGWGSINAYNFVNAQLGITPSPSPTPAHYTVTFTESGLSSGTSWSVTFNGTTQSSTGTGIQFSALNGTYSYTVASVTGYTVSPSSGSITVSGSAQTIQITFTASSTSTSNNGIFSQVNATSSNTYTYNLPEAEKFTVGSSSEAINFVSLYLSGSSGSVQFAIGTSLWGTNVVPLTTVNVNSNQIWYNTTISPVTLTGGTDYYLTVEGSGSIQWGYTSTPSVDLNALQDYWYTSPPSNGLPSGTPTHDNSYPDLYSIGYASTSTVTDYGITFTESGLASGTSWSVTFNGNTQSSTSTSIQFSVPNGTYSYTVGSVTGYSVSPSSGSVTVNGAAQSIGITYTLQDYTVTFTESGLASGTSWSVTFNGNTQSSTGTSMQFSVPDGTYSYTVGSVSGYSVSPSSGSIAVNGASQNVAVTYSSSTASNNGVFSEVMATSSNTYFYTLPEAEKFTIGSSNEYINFITLYLEGTGTITVGIGTSLFSNNVINVASLSVNLPNGGFENISVPVTELTGGTHYFLNVVEPSGNTNVQWAYTTSPSVDLNALQDYWYSGSTLVHDNSYPDLYQIGYSNSAAVVNVMVIPTYHYQNAVLNNLLGPGKVSMLSVQAGSSQPVKTALQNMQETVKQVANHFSSSFLS